MSPFYQQICQLYCQTILFPLFTDVIIVFKCKLEKGENDPVTEEYKGISYTISWNYLLPGYPRMNIYWKEGESEKEMHFLLAREHGREKDDLSDEFEKLRKEKVLEEDWLFREDMQKWCCRNPRSISSNIMTARPERIR